MDSIYVCPMCTTYFETEHKMVLHLTRSHKMALSHATWLVAKKKWVFKKERGMDLEG